MNNSQSIIGAFGALRGADSLVLRQIFRSLNEDIASMQNEIRALRAAIADMKKPGEK